MFTKWASWCSERDSDPVLLDVSEVMNFLAHLFEEGYQYRSLNAYRSAISSVHDRVDGISVGQHPLVARVLKGAFNERPPQPRYSHTWDGNKVTSYIDGMGDNASIDLQELTVKLTMLLAPQRGSFSNQQSWPNNLNLKKRSQNYFLLLLSHTTLSTIARWLETIMGKASIDTAIFKAHSISLKCLSVHSGKRRGTAADILVYRARPFLRCVGGRV